MYREKQQGKESQVHASNAQHKHNVFLTSFYVIALLKVLLGFVNGLKFTRLQEHRTVRIGWPNWVIIDSAFPQDFPKPAPLPTGLFMCDTRDCVSLERRVAICLPLCPSHARSQAYVRLGEGERTAWRDERPTRATRTTRWPLLSNRYLVKHRTKVAD